MAKFVPDDTRNREARPERVVPCHCDEVDNAPAGVHRYCGAHDRATPYPGAPVRSER